MVQILPAPNSFKSQMGEALGNLLGNGLSFAAQMGLNKMQQKKVNKYFTDLKESHPGEKNYELLSDIASSPLSQDQKKDFLKSLLNVDPYRAEQQDRLRKEGISTQYNRAIKELDNALEKRLYPYGSDEYKQALNMRHALAKERDNLLGLGRIGQEEPEMESIEGEEVIPERKNIPKKPKKKLPKFDPTNPQHKARRDQVLKKTGGDRKKAGAVLAKEFEI